MKKAVKTIGIIAALAVTIPLSAYAATTATDNGSGSTGTATTSTQSELKGKQGHGEKHGFGFFQQDVLELLKLDEKTLIAKLGEGQSLAQIAEVQGVSRDTLKKALTDSFNKKIEEQKKAFSDHLDGMIDSKGKAFADKEGVGRHAFGKLDMTPAAKVLGVTVEELKAAIASDKSLADIAKEKGVDVQKVIDAQKAAITEAINQAVKDGKLTQAEADKCLAEAAAMAEKIVNGKGFKGGHKFGGRHDHQ